MKKINLTALVVLALFPALFVSRAAAQEATFNETSIARLQKLTGRESVAFIFASDSHVPFGNIEVLRGLANAANSGDVDFVVFGGDMVQMGNATNYKALRPALKLFNVPFISAIGNHDTSFVDYNDQREYVKRFGKRDFFFDAGPARFVFLNTAISEISEAQLTFLKDALSADKIKFVVTHRPLKYENPIYNTPVGDGSEEFRNIVEAAGVAAVFTGHEHHFGDYSYGGVRYIVSGGAGGSLNSNTDNNFYHCVKVKADRKGFALEVVRLGDGDAD